VLSNRAEEADSTKFYETTSGSSCRGSLSLACITSVRAQTTTLRYGQIPSTIKSVSALHFNIAQRQGLFIREGMNIEMISIEGGAANMMMALDRGAVDITRTASFFLIQAALKGSEGVAIASETATPIYSLIVKPKIKTFADLKGKVVGLTNAVSTISVPCASYWRLTVCAVPITALSSSSGRRSGPSVCEKGSAMPCRSDNPRILRCSSRAIEGLGSPMMPCRIFSSS
jgi:hypothetical protein